MAFISMIPLLMFWVGKSKTSNLISLLLFLITSLSTEWITSSVSISSLPISLTILTVAGGMFILMSLVIASSVGETSKGVVFPFIIPAVIAVIIKLSSEFNLSEGSSWTISISDEMSVVWSKFIVIYGALLLILLLVLFPINKMLSPKMKSIVE
uniref:NADH dehydrogenase subunit 6 n=1 Tax=Goniodes dissimilis TaxID=186210 RepID=A0A9E9ETT1_9NEOP|nr:NADH dehydrogenase subunit 6 [Goniodes dissimilis]